MQKDASPITKVDELQVKRRIEDWKSRLIDLSRRNNLLYYRRTKRGNLHVSSPSPQEIFNRLVLKHKKIEFYLPPEEPEESAGENHVSSTLVVPSFAEGPSSSQLVCNDATRKDLEKTLKNLHTRSLSDYRERGVRILHAAFGKVIWKENETDEVESPLLIVPIELDRESVQDPYTISVPPVEDEVILNPALKVKMQRDFHVEFPPLPEEWEVNSLDSYFNDVARIFRSSGWKIQQNLEIGLFSFHKLVIYNDLESNAALIVQNPLIRAIAGLKDCNLVLDSLPEEPEVDKIEKPEQTFQVLDADSSQRIAIQYAITGQSFVMQGPPGTGKSQTIANIISECIARGKTVLFVSDKMAALEVVYKRLNQANLSSFCLELHSSKANKLEVVTELKRCLDEHTIAKTLPSPQEYENLKALRESLNNYKISLHEIREPLGKSAYQVLGELAQLDQVPFFVVDLPEPLNLTASRMQVLEGLMLKLKNVWQVREDPEFPWLHFIGRVYNIEIRSDLESLLSRILASLRSVEDLSLQLADKFGTERPSRIKELQWLATVSSLAAQSPKPEASWLESNDLQTLIQDAAVFETVFNNWREIKNTLRLNYNSCLFTLPIETSSRIQEYLDKAEKEVRVKNPHEGKLLEQRKALLQFLSLFDESVKEWTPKVQELAKILGMPAENLTIDHIRRLCRIAALSCLPDRPEKIWFDSTTLGQTTELLQRAKKDVKEHNLLKNDLDKKYSPQLLTLDLDEYTRRYNGPYKNLLKYLRPTFFHDQKEIALRSLNGKVPSTIAEDLTLARRLKTLESEVSKYADLSVKLFGSFYAGYDTDFDKIERAAVNAAEILKMCWVTLVPDNLKAQASEASENSLRIAQIGDELTQSLEKWTKAYGAISDLLPLNCIAANDKSIDQIPIAELQSWLAVVLERFVALDTATDETGAAWVTAPKHYSQLISDLKKAEKLRKDQLEFLSRSDQLRKSYGSRFNGLDTEWTKIIELLEWTSQFKDAFGLPEIPTKTVLMVSGGTADVVLDSSFHKALLDLFESKKILESNFEDSLKPSPENEKQEIRFLHLRVLLLRQRLDDLQVWVDFKAVREELKKEGLSEFFEMLYERPPSASLLLDVFRRGAYQEWLNALYDKDKNIGQFRRENHEQIISEFKRVDSELIRLASNRVITEANNRKPKGILINAKDSEVSVLLREAAKKRKHMPLRTLFQKIPTILQRLKPCLLMSPISVSQFLPPGLIHFDLILFDEASQIVPEDSIGSIYRAKNVVIAGDDQQLPPTSFFQKSLIDDTDWEDAADEDTEVFDSILDVSMGIGLPVKTLRWHYRSKHEGLIAFSNHQFYNDRLVTFPSASQERDNLGVEFVYVADGVYDRGGRRDNKKEAEAVANLVFDQFKKYPQKTVGVVTFSFAQMDAVQEALEQLRKKDPSYERFFKEDRLDGFFVKNLESVQGDERDVIIFSVGYGKDQRGELTMNFGPLNKQGGERRLNVAITRAKEKVFLVSSIKASDIDLTNIQNNSGVLTLYHYLDYAERGPIALQTEIRSSGEFESPLEADVAGTIRQMGYDVVPQVGCSGYRIDLGVVDPAKPGNFIMGVECDGATYHSSYSARDRDRLREQVLKQLGWRIYRIWSPTWVLKRESEIKRLADALRVASSSRIDSDSGKADQLIVDKCSSTEKPDSKKIVFGGSEKIGVPYEVCSLHAVYPEYVRVRLSRYPYQAIRKNQFYFRSNREQQVHLLELVVRNEGPIHFDCAVQRLCAAWAVRRSGRKIVAAVKDALYQLVWSKKVVEKGDFLWPVGLEDVKVRIPVPGIRESERKPEYIPPEEIEKAMKLIVKYSFGISPDSLITETARIFSFNRTGENIRDEFEKTYKRLLREGKLKCANNMVSNVEETSL